MIALDGTPNKSRLGANAILAVSMAAAQAAATARGEPLFAYLGQGRGNLLPLPEIQILGGGAHANWRTDVQDFLLIASGARSYAEVMEMTHNVYHAAGDILKQRGKYFGVADEGGYWPEFKTNEEPLQLLVEAIEQAGYRPGQRRGDFAGYRRERSVRREDRHLPFRVGTEKIFDGGIRRPAGRLVRAVSDYFHRRPDGGHGLGRLADDFQGTGPTRANHWR